MLVGRRSARIADLYVAVSRSSDQARSGTASVPVEGNPSVSRQDAVMSDDEEFDEVRRLRELPPSQPERGSDIADLTTSLAARWQGVEFSAAPVMLQESEREDIAGERQKAAERKRARAEWRMG